MQKANEIHKQLERRCNEIGYFPKPFEKSDSITIRKALIAGLYFNAARRQETSEYRMFTSGKAFKIHPSSVLSSKYVPFC